MCLLYSLRFKSTYKLIAAKFLFEKINKQLLLSLNASRLTSGKPFDTLSYIIGLSVKL